MSVIQVGVGQCGVELCANAAVAGPKVLVDAEAKVVQRLAASGPGRPALVFEQSGCGNNFAIGFHQRPQIAEVLDAPPCICLWHSFAGGSGSGIGSRLLQLIREEFSKCTINTVSVLPFRSYGSPLRHFNTALALQQLYADADAIVAVDNERVHELLQKQRQDCDLHDMNNYITSSFKGVFDPLNRKDSPGKHLRSVLAHVVPNTQFKLLEVWSTSTKQRSSALQWRRNSSALVSCCPKFDFDKRRVRSLAVQLVARGEEAPRYSTSEDFKSTVDKGLRTVSRDAIRYSATERTMSKSLTTISALLNSSTTISILRILLSKGDIMLQEGAFLQWYERHGCEADVVASALAELKERIADYDTVLR